MTYTFVLKTCKILTYLPRGLSSTIVSSWLFHEKNYSPGMKCHRAIKLYTGITFSNISVNYWQNTWISYATSKFPIIDVSKILFLIKNSIKPVYFCFVGEHLYETYWIFEPLHWRCYLVSMCLSYLFYFLQWIDVTNTDNVISYLILLSQL